MLLDFTKTDHKAVFSFKVKSKRGQALRAGIFVVFTAVWLLCESIKDEIMMWY